MARRSLKPRLAGLPVDLLREDRGLQHLRNRLPATEAARREAARARLRCLATDFAGAVAGASGIQWHTGFGGLRAPRSPLILFCGPVYFGRMPQHLRAACTWPRLVAAASTKGVTNRVRRWEFKFKSCARV